MEIFKLNIKCQWFLDIMTWGLAAEKYIISNIKEIN